MTLSPATQAILDRYADDTAEVSWLWESMAAEAVLRHGGPTDAEALLPLFLSAPAAHDALVPILARHGDRRLAERLLEATVEGGRLRDGVPSGVLHAVGRLGYTPATSLLWEHVDDSHEVSKDACLGLSHLPCEELRGAIAESLEKHEGAALFPEFLPVLAAKTQDPGWLDRLVDWGGNHASTDCNGGLILGIALHGEQARPAFTRLLWDTRWDACDRGTGSALWTYASTRVLGLDLPQLYADLRELVRTGADPDVRRDAVRSFLTLVEFRCAEPWTGVAAAEARLESSDTLYHLLFAQPLEDGDTLTEFADRVFEKDEHYSGAVRALEDSLRAEAAHEWALRAVTSR